MTLPPIIRGLQTLQHHVAAFGDSIVNAFDVEAWQRATTLETLGVRLIVREGTVSVSLRQTDPGGAEHELARLAVEGIGTAVGPALRLAELRGAVRAVVEHASEGARFEIVYLTDDPPSQPQAAVNYIFCTFRRQQYVQHNADVFRDYLRRWPAHADAAHLTVVDNGSVAGSNDCGVIGDSHVSVLPNDNTGGAGGFGRGIYETVYGELAERGFTHLCLLDDDIHLHPEMFARNTAMVRYLRPGVHLGAPMYPTAAPDAPPRRSACFGHRYRGTIDPSDTALGTGLDTGDIRAFLSMDRRPDTTGWWWDCIAVEDILRIGLPYPFFVKMDDVEYGLRLRDAGVELVIPFSFWVLHDDFEEKYSAAMQYFRFRNRWILLARQGRIEDAAAFVRGVSALVRGFIAGRKYEHAALLLDAMAHLRKGPEALVAEAGPILAGVLRRVRHERNAPMPQPPEGAEIMNGLHEPASPRTRRLNALTLNNHFMPLRERLVIDTTRPGRLTDVRRGKTVSYWNRAKGVGYTVTRDSRRAAALALRLGWLAWRLQREMPTLAARYRRASAHLTSPAFWAGYGRFGTTPRLMPDGRNRPEDHAARPREAARTLAAGIEARRRRAAARAVSDEDLAFLEAMRNRHQGQRCFVLGNGPSLTIADLDRLQGAFTFASNKIYLAFDQTRWRPTYYSVEDLLVAQNCRAEIMALEGITKILPDHMLRFLPRRPNHHYVRWLPPADNRSPFREFSRDLTKGVCWGSTVTYSMMQMAVHMGFREIILIGLDHSYVEPATRQDGALVSEGERNHFHPDYRKPGERWHLPVLDRLERSYQFARESCEAMGVRVLNASRASRLDVFERADLDDLLPPLPGTARPRDNGTTPARRRK